MTPLGKAIKKRMLDCDMNSNDVCERCRIQRSVLSAILHGPDRLSIGMIERIADALDTPTVERNEWHGMALAQKVDLFRQNYYRKLEQIREGEHVADKIQTDRL